VWYARVRLIVSMCVVVIATLWTKAISRHPPWRARWLPPHYAVLLCFFGQLLIQEPVLAAQRLLSGWCGPHYIGLENDIHSGARQEHQRLSGAPERALRSHFCPSLALQAGYRGGSRSSPSRPWF
jgi:hypothetical protein